MAELKSSPEEADELVRFLRHETEAAALRFGIAAQAARDIAGSIEEAMRQRLGGEKFYVCKSIAAVRRRRVLAAYDGKNLKQVCEDFGVKPRTVYRYLGWRRRLASKKGVRKPAP